MKIAVITHAYPNLVHPTEASFIQELNGWLGKKVDVNVIVPTVRSIPGTKRWKHNHAQFIPSESEEAIFRCRYLSIPRRKLPGFVKWRLAHQLIKLIKKINPDILHLHWTYPEAIVIPLLKETFDIPIVITLHGGAWYQLKDSASHHDLVEQGLQSADLVTTVGDVLAESVRANMNVRADKVRAIANGIDTDQFKPVSSAEKGHIRQRLGWRSDRPHILMVAHIRPEKGHHHLLKTIIQSEKLKQCQFHFVGEFAFESYQRDLEALIQENELTNIVWHGNVKREEVVAYYQGSDLAVLPSRYEGFGLAVLEAQACGVPVVATKSGGPEEILKKTRGGTLVPVDDEGALQDALIDQIGQLEHNKPRQLHERVNKHFGYPEITEKYVNCYRELISS